ncbi:hypothetical protein ACSU64_20550 [Bacillaceae bacterium C204]|uniref:hypothetical protein n=1 Tax=Neobacillus sp. 204 TaxID=3383351 RepID=UPI00397A4843
MDLLKVLALWIWAAALRSDQKGKASFYHSVRVASALNGPITTVCTANAAIPNEPKTGKPENQKIERSKE